MLTVGEIEAELARVSYKPGWTFRVYQGRWEGLHLVIRTEVPDAYHEGENVVLDVHSFLPPLRDRWALHSWLTWRLARIEVHEMREFYRVDGQCWDDPHAEGASEDRP